MAVSSWKRGVALPLGLILWLLAFGRLAVAQMVLPSNLTSDLAPEGTSRFILNSTQNLGVLSLRLFPLTNVLASMPPETFQSFIVTGSLVNVNPDNVSQLESDVVAYINCDDAAYPGNLNASNTFVLATTNNPPPSAIILYSTSSTHCNYTAQDGFEWDRTFTTVDQMPATIVANRSVPSPAVSILPDLAAVRRSGNDTGNSSSSSSSSDNVNGPAPTTATAMIILYAITGIITALFIVIIVTGAIRAHRHPERYGPRNIVGRTRQSRARGIARAMLETIPIVRFGDPDPAPTKPAEDIEMAAQTAEPVNEQSKEANSQTESPETPAEPPAKEAETQSQHSGTAARPDGTDEHGTLGCSICTEDFAKGQEVRVLPCNHKFHPDCVDPWLLNVSGTCPLCRTNLNPNAPEENTEEEVPEGRTTFTFTPPVESEPANTRRPMSSLITQRLRGRRISTLTAEERLAAVRALNQQGGTSGERGRLSERLRDRLRIRTRRQGDESEGVTPGSATPAEASGAVEGSDTARSQGSST